MGTIYIDDVPVTFKPGENVLQAALNAGIETSYFCYHEALGSAGSCRVCAMEMEPAREGDKARVVMSCMQPAQDGQRYRLDKGKADKVRKNVVEYYMTRHPHDCPVCDEAGECHLQDMTILSHQTYRRYDGKKMTFPNQEMGPLIWNTANRCITCYRCVRFYQDYALGDDFGAYGSGQKTTFRRSEPGAFDSPFSGNLIDVCPTGTFTDKVYRRKYSRTWQLEKAISVCGHCSVGCNTEPGGRAGTLRRVHPYPNVEINPFFICDRGRFGEHYSESDSRPLIPLSNGSEDTLDNIFSHVADCLENTRGRIGILSSPDEDVETHLALQKLAIHYDGLFSPFLRPEEEKAIRIALMASVKPPSLVDIEKADGVFIAGSLTEAAPMMDLAVRQLIAKGKPVYMIHAAPSRLGGLITERLGAGYVTRIAPVRWANAIEEMSASQTAEEGPNLFANLEPGQQIVMLGVADEMDVPAINAFHDLARDLECQQLNVRTGFAFNAANAAGAAIVSNENSAEKLLDAIQAGSIETLVVCGADPLGSVLSRRCDVREKVNQLIVLDNITTRTVKKANIVIPMTTWSERSGLSVNYEGRLQAFDRAYTREGVISPLAFVSRLIKRDLVELCRDRDSWVEEISGQLVMADQVGVRLDLVSILGKMPSREKINNGQGIQLVKLRWHGEGVRANFAVALAKNNLWKDNNVYLHEDTAKDLGIKSGDMLRFSGEKGSVSLIFDNQMPKHCFSMTSRTLFSIGYLPNVLLSEDEFTIERGQA